MRRFGPQACAWAVLMVLGGAISYAVATPVADPFRPFPSAEATSPGVSTGISTLHLSAVLISPYRHQAIINNHLVTVGDRIGGAQVLKIGPRGVLIMRQGSKLWLQLVRRDITKPEGG